MQSLSMGVWHVGDCGVCAWKDVGIALHNVLRCDL